MRMDNNNDNLFILIQVALHRCTHVTVKINKLYYAVNWVFTCPSLSMVALICSEPGVMVNLDLALIPCLRAWRARLAARLMSS